MASGRFRGGGAIRYSLFDIRPKALGHFAVDFEDGVFGDVAALLDDFSALALDLGACDVFPFDDGECFHDLYSTWLSYGLIRQTVKNGPPRRQIGRQEFLNSPRGLCLSQPIPDEAVPPQVLADMECATVDIDGDSILWHCEVSDRNRLLTIAKSDGNLLFGMEAVLLKEFQKLQFEGGANACRVSFQPGPRIIDIA